MARSVDPVPNTIIPGSQKTGLLTTSVYRRALAQAGVGAHFRSALTAGIFENRPALLPPFLVSAEGEGDAGADRER
jgi:hypothetical protein